MYTHFIDKKLPETFDEFCTILNKLFPVIIDNKALIILEARKYDKKMPQSLGPVFSNFEKYHLKMVSLQEFNKSEEQVAHDAGYDAWMTGYCFVYLCEMIKNKHILTASTGKGGKKNQADDAIDFRNDPNFPKLLNGDLKEGYQGYSGVLFSSHGGFLDFNTHLR